MFQPSGKGSIWILTIQVQATCNLEAIQVIIYVIKTAAHCLQPAPLQEHEVN